MAPPPKTVTVPTPKFAPQEEAQMKGFFRRLGESIAGAGAIGSGGAIQPSTEFREVSLGGTGPAFPLAVAQGFEDVSTQPGRIRTATTPTRRYPETGPRVSTWGHPPEITMEDYLKTAEGKEAARKIPEGQRMHRALRGQANYEIGMRALESGATMKEQRTADYLRRSLGLPVTASGDEVSSRLAAARGAPQGAAAWGAGGRTPPPGSQPAAPPPRGGAARALGPGAAAAMVLADPVSSSLGRRLAPNWTEQTQPRLTPGGLFQPEDSAFRDPLIQTQQDVEGLLAAIDRERGYREAEENIVNQQILEEAAYGHPEADWTGIAEFEPTYVEGMAGPPSFPGRMERAQQERLGETTLGISRGIQGETWPGNPDLRLPEGIQGEPWEGVQVNPEFRLPHQLEAERAEEARLGRVREEWGRKWGTSGERRARIAELEESKRRLMEEEAGAGGGPAAVSPRLPGGGRTEQQQLQYYQNLMREIQRRAYLGGR